MIYDKWLFYNWRFIYVSRLLKSKAEERGVYQELQFEGKMAVAGEQKYKMCHAQILGILLLSLKGTFLCPFVPDLWTSPSSNKAPGPVGISQILEREKGKGEPSLIYFSGVKEEMMSLSRFQ